MISEYWTFGLQNLFVRTREPFFSNLRTFGLKNLRTREPSNLRTFGLIGCNPCLQLCSATAQLDLPFSPCTESGVLTGGPPTPSRETDSCKCCMTSLQHLLHEENVENTDGRSCAAGATKIIRFAEFSAFEPTKLAKYRVGKSRCRVFRRRSVNGVRQGGILSPYLFNV